MSRDENVGRRIGPYEVQRELGEGGMGRVYLARHTSLDRLVALKVLHPGMADDEVSLERFRREAQAAAAFQHAHVVSVFASGSDAARGEHYIVFEYIDGPSLQELIDAGPLAEQRTLEVARDVLKALRYAGSKGIVHRDVKPDNILITGDGVPKLADLGLAKRFDVSQARVTQTGQIVGTPLYMAPEQALGYAELDARADLYALGLCLWAALTGEVPFDESGTTSSLQVLSRHINEDLPDVRTRAPGVSEDAARLVMGLAARSRDRRYPAAADALADCERILQGRPAKGPPVAEDALAPAPTPLPRDDRFAAVRGGEELSKTASTPAWAPGGHDGSRATPAQIVAAALLGITLTVLGVSQLGPPSKPAPTPAHPARPGPPSIGPPPGAPEPVGPAEPASEPPPATPAPGPPDLRREDPAVLATRIEEVGAWLMRDAAAGHRAARELAREAGTSSEPDLRRCGRLLERALTLAGRPSRAERQRVIDAIRRDHEVSSLAPRPGVVGGAVDRELARWAGLCAAVSDVAQALADPRAAALGDDLAAVPPDRGVAATADALLELAELLDRVADWRGDAARRARVTVRLEQLRAALGRTALAVALDGDVEALPLLLGDVLRDPHQSLLTALSNLAPATARRSHYVEARLVDVPPGASMTRMPAFAVRVVVAEAWRGTQRVVVEVEGLPAVSFHAAGVAFAGEGHRVRGWPLRPSLEVEPRVGGILVRVAGARPSEVVLTEAPLQGRVRFSVRAEEGAALAAVQLLRLPTRPGPQAPWVAALLGEGER